MLAVASLDDGMTVAFGFFAVAMVLMFIVGVLLGFVAWMKRFLG